MATHSSILPMEGEAWWATVHGVTKSQTRVLCFCFAFEINLSKHLVLIFLIGVMDFTMMSFWCEHLSFIITDNQKALSL